MPLHPLLTLVVLFGCLPLRTLLALPTRPPDQQLPTIAPIQAEGAKLTEAQYRSLEQKWKETAILAPFAKACAEEPWFPTASSLITEAFQLQAEAAVLPYALAPLAARFRDLIENEPTAPLIRILAAQALFDDTGDWREPSALLAPVLNLHDMSPWLRAQALQLHIALLKHQGGEYRFPRGDLVDTLIQILAESDLVSSTPPEVMVRQQMSFLTAAEVTLDDYLIRWLEAAEASVLPEWAKLTLLGFGETELAWIKRSTKWASEVTEEQWQGFGQHLTKAREHLLKAWALDTSRPEIPAQMITVAMGDSTSEDELRLWFDRAVAAQFDYYPAYNKMLWALAPRWGGSHEQMLAFGLACARTKRFDTGIPAYLFHAALEVTCETREVPGVFADIDTKTSILETAAQYIDSAASTAPALILKVRRSTSSISAWLAGDASLAARGFEAIGGNLNRHGRSFLSCLLMHESRFRAEVAAGSGQFGPQVKAFANLSQAKQPEEWATALASIPMDDLSPEARHYVAEWRDWQTLKSRLESGDWTAWKPHPFLVTLSSTGGRWQVEDDALVAIGDDSTGIALLLKGLEGVPLEIRAEIEVSDLTPPEPSPQGWSFGVTHHWQPASYGERVGGLCLAVQARHSGSFEAISYNRRPSQSVGNRALSFTNPLAFQSWSSGGKFGFAVNSKWLFDSQTVEPLELPEGDGSLGFITERLPTGVRVLFRKIELKTVGTTPSPLATPTLAKAALTKPPVASIPADSKPQFNLPVKALLLVTVLILAFAVHFWIEKKKSENA